MNKRSDRPAAPLRLVLDFGETVELDGSTLYDPAAEQPAPAVVLRMPPHRAAWLGRVLDAYTRVCRLTGDDLAAEESGPAWALARASVAAGHTDRSTCRRGISGRARFRGVLLAAAALAPVG